MLEEVFDTLKNETNESAHDLKMKIAIGRRFLTRLLDNLPIFLLQFLLSLCEFAVLYRGILNVPQSGLLKFNSLDVGDFTFLVHAIPTLEY